MGVTSERTISYREVVGDCKKEGVDPPTKKDFLKMMARNNFKIADEDFNPFEILVALTYSSRKFKE